MTLFDHFVGELQEMLGNVELKRFCGLEVDDKLKLDWRILKGENPAELPAQASLIQ